MILFEIRNNKKIIDSDFIIKTICNQTELESVIGDINTLINQFNSEYVWDNMFNTNDVISRILENQTLFILYYKENPIGYVFFKKIKNNSYFGYNLYVTKKTKKPKYAAYWFYNNVTNIILRNSERIEVEVDDWNCTIIDIIKNIGYYKIDK